MVGTPLIRLLRYARPFRAKILLASGCSILNKLFDLAPPFIIGAAVDVVVQKQDSIVARLGIVDPFMQLLLLGVLTAIIWTFESVFEWLFGVLWRHLAQAIQHEARMDVFDHVQGLDLTWFEDHSTGGLLAVLSDDVNQLERFLDGGANDIIQLAVTAITVIAAFFLISPDLAWLAMIPVPVVIIGSLWFQKRLEPHYDAMRGKVGDLNAQLANSLGGMATVKSFTAESNELGRLRTESHGYAERNRRVIILSAAFSPLIRVVIMCGFMVTLLYGGWLTLEGTLGVGAFALLVFLTQRLLWPFTRVGSILDLYQRAMASTRRIFELLDVRPSIVDGTTELPLESIQGSVTFENVHFAYNAKAPVLQGLDLECPTGATTAIVGSTGAGKSTVIKMLLRFYDVDPDASGPVLLDGHDLRKLKLRQLRRAIALVSQDVYLFDGTIRENLAYGWPGSDEDPNHWEPPSDEQLYEAARLAEAHDFICSLPEGYETVVGERGQKLSGGQRQRIAMARAVLKDAPILVLDEATASVDNETEAAIQRSLRTICRDRTTIVIAHRLSTVRHAQSINVLDAGRVVERGTHEELLAHNGIYAHLWRVQTGERIDEAMAEGLS
ncbi:MAG: ABC transporter [Planctomycetes bacterium TMED75]|nr:ABC transporter [Planctomycetaceae bacterium]OUU92238.1 MAG: ABC transporter [Planctomycetes bacterium TMED75]